MFIRTEPQLFKEMLRIRVGLITEVIASEMGRLLEGSKLLYLYILTLLAISCSEYARSQVGFMGYEIDFVSCHYYI
jgi:hypothetical protein